MDVHVWLNSTCLQSVTHWASSRRVWGLYLEQLTSTCTNPWQCNAMQAELERRIMVQVQALQEEQQAAAGGTAACDPSSSAPADDDACD